jgi:RNA polymerase sigma-70 factor, ECF subfamily
MTNALALSALTRTWITARQSADPELLNRIADGDKLAMRVLFAQFNVRVYRFVLCFVRDEVIAEDVVNEVFVEVWRNASRFQGNSQVSTWILAIARFKALSAIRRRKDEMLDDVETASIPDTADDPEMVMQKKDRVSILRECMSHLSRQHREIIDLVYYHDKSIVEVAQIVGVPENTAKTRIFHARSRMAKLLQQAGIDQTYQ